MSRRVFRFAINKVNGLGKGRDVRIITNTSTRSIAFKKILRFMSTSLNGTSLLASFIIYRAPRLINRFRCLKTETLSTRSFPCALGISNVPRTTRRTPNLRRFILVRPILTSMLKSIFRVKARPTLRNVFTRDGLFLLFFIRLRLRNIFPIIRRFLPSFVIHVSSFYTRITTMRAKIRTMLPMFIKGLLRRNLPTIFPLYRKPFRRRFRPNPFQLTFPRIMPLLLRIRLSRLGRNIMGSAYASLVTRRLRLSRKIIRRER